MKIVDNDRGYESCGRNSRRECCNHQKPGKAILNCGSGGVGPLPVITEPLCNPIPVTSVSIDTRCMENPKVLLQFNAQINLPANAAVTLNFVILRTTKCGCPQNVGGTFTFSTIAAVLEAETFSFQFCDCMPCPDCTTYTILLDSSSTVVGAGLTITNATVSALAVEDLC